jgi:hypothetical protein
VNLGSIFAEIEELLEVLGVFYPSGKHLKLINTSKTPIRFNELSELPHVTFFMQPRGYPRMGWLAECRYEVRSLGNFQRRPILRRLPTHHILASWSINTPPSG